MHFTQCEMLVHTPKYFCFYSVFITTKLSVKHHLESSMEVKMY